jgi:hypothetical protein
VHPDGKRVHEYHGDQNQVWHHFRNASEDFKSSIERTMAIFRKENAPGYRSLLAIDPPSPEPFTSNIAANPMV